MSGLEQAQTAIAGMLSGEKQPPPEVSETQQVEQAEEILEDQDLEQSDVVSESEPEQTPEPQYYPVTVDGEQYEVTLDEALGGYQRQQSFTKKTQALAEDRKAFEVEKSATLAERDRYARTLDELQTNQSAQPEPDWETLSAEDPIEYLRQREIWRTGQERKDRIASEHQQLRMEQQQEQQQQFQHHLKSQQQLLSEMIPAWSDPEVATQERSAIRDYARSIGYSDQELANVTDARAVLALRHGMLSQQTKTLGQQKIQQIRPVGPGQVQQAPRRRTQVTKARQRLSKTGTVSDAAEVFKHLLSAS